MNRIVLLLASFGTALAFGQPTPSKIDASAQQKNYQPPVFTDSDRLKNIETVFPVIDKIYQEYAAKNHYPGVAYGLVVDGKLVHSGGLGCTNVAKKRRQRPSPCFALPQ